MHTYIYIHKDTYFYMNIVCIFTYSYVNMHIYTQKCIHIDEYIRVQMNAQKHKCLYLK
jgi:hypothetical protein